MGGLRCARHGPPPPCGTARLHPTPPPGTGRFLPVPALAQGCAALGARDFGRKLRASHPRAVATPDTVQSHPPPPLTTECVRHSWPPKTTPTTNHSALLAPNPTHRSPQGARRSWLPRTQSQPSAFSSRHPTPPTNSTHHWAHPCFGLPAPSPTQRLCPPQRPPSPVGLPAYRARPPAPIPTHPPPALLTTGCAAPWQSLSARARPCSAATRCWTPRRTPRRTGPGTGAPA